MLDIDLESMQLCDLKRLHEEVESAIKTYQDRQRKVALSELEAKAEEFGFSLWDLTGKRPRKARKNPPKYKHPENPNLTWTGRGRPPAWIKDAITRGESLEQFLIAK